MNTKSQAWGLLCDLARIRADNPRGVWAEAYRLAEQIAGTPWADCKSEEWCEIIAKLGGVA